MSTNFAIADDFIAEQNSKKADELAEDYEYLGKNCAAERLKSKIWLDGRKRFKSLCRRGAWEPAELVSPVFREAESRAAFMKKLEDCATINQLVRSTGAVSLHIPWDRTENLGELKSFAETRGLTFDAINSNTFQDQIDQKHSYKFGSLSHENSAVRQQAIEHNLECLEIGKQLDSKALTVWIGDGSNFPGQTNFRRALECYLDSMREIYAKIPDDWRLFIEHKFYEPAFYSTVINDWGTSFICAKELGEKAMCLVDLGHHAPNVNIEQIVARLIQFNKLGGFHFNDSKYGDDDLDAGSIKPFQLFLVFNELVDAELNNLPNFDPAYMIDQSHNVTDPIESLMTSAVEISRAFVQAHLVDRAKLEDAQRRNDAVTALATLKEAFTTDVSPILAIARQRNGGAIDPVATYRASKYRTYKTKERPAQVGVSAGIV